MKLTYLIIAAYCLAFALSPLTVWGADKASVQGAQLKATTPQTLPAQKVAAPPTVKPKEVPKPDIKKVDKQAVPPTKKVTKSKPKKVKSVSIKKKPVNQHRVTASPEGTIKVKKLTVPKKSSSQKNKSKVTASPQGNIKVNPSGYANHAMKKHGPAVKTTPAKRASIHPELMTSTKSKHKSNIDNLKSRPNRTSPGKTARSSQVQSIHKTPAKVSTPTVIGLSKGRNVTSASQADAARKALEVNEAAEHLEELAALEQFEQNKALRMPEQAAADPLVGTGLAGQGPAKMGNEPRDNYETVRDMMIGRGGPYDANPDTYLSANIDNRTNAAQYGVGSAQDRAGAPSPEGLASDTNTVVNKDKKGNVTSVVTTTNEQNNDGTTTNETTVHTHEGTTVTSEIRHNKTGEVLFTSIIHYGNDGFPEYHREFTVQGGVVWEVDNDYNNIMHDFRRPDSQPNENAPSKYDDCNPVTGWNCKKEQKDPMDMVSQPAEGEENTGERTSSPTASVGTSVVTNPDEFHQSGGSGNRGRGATPGYGVVDPEEIVPGNPVPPPE